VLKYFLLLTFAWGLFAQETSQEELAFDEIYALYKEHKYQEARRGFELLYKLYHDNDAAYILGYMYEHGQGCSVDYKQSTYYYKHSSKGYYFQQKDDPARDAKKEQKKLFKVVDDLNDTQTLYTIKQYAQSLYNIKAYKANYFLPVSYKYDGVYHQVGTHQLKSTEIEFQFSLRYDFGTNLLGLHEIYSFGYTQRSFWQAYGKSAYFRESNYNPEFFTTIPIGYNHIKALRIALAHQSNGRGGTNERSWNYIAGSVFFQTGLLFTKVRLWHRFKDTIDYNPTLIDYMGHGDVEFIFPYKKHLMKLLLRSNFDGENGVEFSYSYPVSKDLFLYIKTFNGYGESLIDFDNKIDKVGIGFSISR